jgi:hypothetical protein
MSTSPLIGIIGLKRSGKDTYASRLVSHHGYTRLALADPMREFALALDPIVAVYDAGEEWGGVLTERLSEVVAREGWEQAKTRDEVRRTLQRLGTEAGRGVLGENVWINVTDKIQYEVPGPVVITDIRFPNEYEWITRRGGYLVRVVRAGTFAGDHSSETMAGDLTGFPADMTVLNETTVADLHEHADIVARVVATKPVRQDPTAQLDLF